MKPHEVAERIHAAHAAGEAIVSVLATTGAHAGARVVVTASGILEGTLGDADLDAAALECARAAFAHREPQLSNGLFAELHAAIEQLYVFGAGHIAVPLVDFALALGFHVMVLDDRATFVNGARFPPETSVRMLDLAAPLDGLALAQSYVVLVTRAHEHDFDILRALLAHADQPRYIGMIGSRRRVRAAFNALIAGGVEREQLARIHAPIGLDIGAETPAEIALSIAAELVRVRRGGSAEPLAREERVLERFF